MSKDLVKLPVLKDRTGLVPLVRPEDRFVSASDLFTSAVETKWFNYHTADGDWFQTTLIVGVFSPILTFLTTYIGLPALNGMSADESGGIALWVAGGTFAVATSSFTLLARHIKKVATRIKAVTYGINKKTFVNWLRSRYGIQVDSENIDVMIRWISAGKPAVDFYDVTGKKFRLKANEAGEYFIIDFPAVKKPVDYVATVVVSKIPESFLTGEALILGESIVARMDRLKTFDLSVESNHIVSRIEQDLNQALQLNVKLHNLGDENAVEIVDILSELNQELNELIVGQVSEIKNELAIQKRYIKSRQLHQSNPDLTLSLQSSAVEETKVEVVENV